MKKSFSEAIKLKDGILYNLAYHQNRINKTQEMFYQSQINLTEISSHIPDSVKTGLYKCRVVYTDKIESVEFTAYNLRDIKVVKIVIDNEIDYRYKYTDRNKLYKLLSDSGCDDIIIIKNGLVTDSSSSNLVFESEHGFFTPSSYLLPGTKRQLLIDKGIVKEKEITIDDIPFYQRIFFINAMIDLEDKVFVDIKQLKSEL